MTHTTANTEHLRRTLRGPVHEPGTAAYDRERATFGGALDARPAVVVEAVCAADVRAALLGAREAGGPFAVQGTGHGTKVACDGGLLLKTGRLRGVLVDPNARVARVGAGATWDDVVTVAAPFGLAPVTGSHLSVGVAGFTLGGGIGPLARSFGLGADNLVAAEVVTADGRWLRVDDDHHPDLFWALRGGGGNFAVVTAMEIRLHPVGRVVAGQLRFARDRAADVLAAFAAGAQARPEALSATVSVTADAVTVHALHAGSPEAAERALAPLRRAGGPPRADTLRLCRPHEADLGGVPPRSFTLLGDVPVDALLATADRTDGVEVRQWGGAIARGTTPAGHRHVPYSVSVAGDAAALAPLRAHAAGAFLNLLGDVTRTADAYTPGDLAALRDVKAAWDPDNVLGLTHNIAPARTARTAQTARAA